MSKCQTVTALRRGQVERLELPDPESEVLPGVCWGRHEDFFTPAFWRARLWIDGEDSPLIDYSIGRSLREEVAACILGGFGMPAEVGLAAFKRLQSRGLLNGDASSTTIEGALREPLAIGVRRVKYRYPATKSRFVSAAMDRMTREAAPINSPLALRNWLITFDGIGPKTASWITRNCTHCDEVAILDIHLIRAGLLMGLFSPWHRIPRDYFRMEACLVTFARNIGVKLSKFDSMVWCYMRRLNGLAIDALGRSSSCTNLA